MSRIRSVSRYRSPALALALSGVAMAGCAGSPSELDPGSLKQGISALPDLVVPTGVSMVVNTYGAVTADAQPGDQVLSVSATDLGNLNLSPGDLVMVYQAQGAQIGTSDDMTYGAVTSLNGAGLYEVFRVDGTDATQSQIKIAAGCALRNGYSAAGKTQVIRVPRYNNVTLEPSVNGVTRGTLSAQPWNGQVGGVLALRAAAIQDSGSIDVSGQGFRGGAPNASTGLTNQAGYRSTMTTLGGEKGESIAGAQTDYDGMGGRFGRGAPANGGGGGNSFNSSGGGGANAGASNSYTGDGVMGNTQMYGAAWMLDPYYVANNAFANSSGGGRGGYTLSSMAQDPTMVGPGNAMWGSDNRLEHGGRGGHPLAPNAAQRIFLGGGGGGSDADSGVGGVGGNGGGIALLLASSLNATAGGCVLANGAAGTGSFADGAGGGGGGGSVVLGIPAIRGVNVEAAGNQGGSVNLVSASAFAFGPGGGGGGGYVAMTGAASQMASAAGGASGTTNATSVAAFPVNGATNGSAGAVGTTTAQLPVCLPADLSVTYAATPTTVRINTPIHYTATVSNAGPEDASNVQVTITVPANTTVDTTPAGSGWNCTLAGSMYTCTLASLASGAMAPAIDFIFDAQMNADTTITSMANVMTTETTDPNTQNNASSVTVNIDRTTVNGDGFGCQMTAARSTRSGAGAAGLGLLLLALAACAQTRARRRSASW